MPTPVAYIYLFLLILPSLALTTSRSNCTYAVCASNDTLINYPGSHFLRNGTFKCTNSDGHQAYTNITCPGSVDVNGRFKAIDHCYLPAGTTVSFKDSQKCSSINSQLVSLGVYNGFVAATSVFAGHGSVRRKLAWFNRSTWTPWAGMITAASQIIAMMISAGVTRNGGPGTEFGAILGLWTMRPRIGFITYIWSSLCICFGRNTNNYYSHTLKDIILSENILNIFAFFFAFKLLRSRHRSAWVPRAGLSTAGYLGIHADEEEDYGYEDYNDRGTLAFHVISFIHMIAAFASNWVLWGVFMNIAGTNYCPGSQIGIGFLWGIVFILNAVLRAVLGGP